MIECEHCFHWCHSKCIGISQPVAKNYPFICPYCTSSLLQEVSSLRSKVSSLTSEIAVLQSQLSSASQTSQSFHSRKNQSRHPHSNSLDRRFNLVVFGIGEQVSGTPRATRLREDSTEVSSILSPLLPSFSDHSVRDCFWLGKYSSNRSRPLLVSMTRTCDVATILSNKSSLADRPHIRISSDLPLHLRKSRSILMKARYDLIRSGVERKSIRLSTDSIYVDKVKHGSVVDNEFKCVFRLLRSRQWMLLWVMILPPATVLLPLVPLPVLHLLLVKYLPQAIDVQPACGMLEVWVTN